MLIQDKESDNDFGRAKNEQKIKRHTTQGKGEKTKDKSQNAKRRMKKKNIKMQKTEDGSRKTKSRKLINI
jgi:hypothetical protein